MTIRVAIADDQSLVRDGFRVQLTLAPDFEFVGGASNGLHAVELARRQRPDVLLMDVRMPELDGIEATRRITTDPQTGGVRILVLTTFELDEYVYAALAAGASGFLLKDVSPEDLAQGIRIVAAGDALLAPSVTRLLVREFARRPTRTGAQPQALQELTEREREVLVIVAQGLSNAEIAARLVISPATAKTHVSRILTKLGVRDRAQLVVMAYECGLVRPGTG
ncbi:MAG TPA: response regulator transcription factor [Actinomycetes bacterium]|nr:response regulator transcription factor [Actinomycetes bacterium]